jgi:hypothetical protein
MAIEIVDLPIKNDGFPYYVSLPQGRSQVQNPMNTIVIP